MSTIIHPYLLARLVAVQEAFNQPSFRYVASANASANATKSVNGKSWKDIIKEDDDGDGGQGGGGGTMKGHRGKNAVHAAANLRRLSRR